MTFKDKNFNYFILNLVHAYLQIISFLNMRYNTQNTVLEQME